jgi:hypothetical protein
MPLPADAEPADDSGHETSPSQLFFDLDCVGWGWNTEQVATQCHELMAEIKPLWVRVANWTPWTVEFLKRYPGQRVLWKLECTRKSTYAKGPDGRSIADVWTEAMDALDIQLVPYTFDSWNTARIKRAVPALADREFGEVPIAQPPCLDRPDRAAARAGMGLGPDDIVYGTGGALDAPDKGIEEVVDGFLTTCHEPRAKLVVQAHTPVASRATWERWQSHPATKQGRLVLRTGNYGGWRTVTTFYRALDYFLVNSSRESWCRMHTEAIGYGIPTIVLRSELGIHDVVGGITYLDKLGDFSDPAFGRALESAAAEAPRLRAYVHREFAPPAVRRIFLDFMRRNTDESALTEFDALVADPVIAARVDPSLVY